MNRCDKSYTVTKTQAFQIGRKIEALLVD